MLNQFNPDTLWQFSTLKLKNRKKNKGGVGLEKQTNKQKTNSTSALCHQSLRPFHPLFQTSKTLPLLQSQAHRTTQPGLQIHLLYQYYLLHSLLIFTLYFFFYVSSPQPNEPISYFYASGRVTSIPPPCSRSTNISN